MQRTKEEEERKEEGVTGTGWLVAAAGILPPLSSLSEWKKRHPAPLAAMEPWKGGRGFPCACNELIKSQGSRFMVALAAQEWETESQTAYTRRINPAIENETF